MLKNCSLFKKYTILQFNNQVVSIPVMYARTDMAPMVLLSQEKSVVMSRF